MLRGTASTRVELKRRNDAVERLIEGHAERFAAVALAVGAGDERAFLARAWRALLRNSAHDSICGCSIDKVHRDMEPRWEVAERVGGEVARRALSALAARLAPTADAGEITLVVFNPSPWMRSGSVEIEVAPYRHLPLGQRLFGAEGEPRDALDVGRARLLDPTGRTSRSKSARSACRWRMR